MITDFNEDELYRLQAKLDMLMKYKRIESLGYHYEPDTYIFLDPTVEDGYEPVDQVEFISSALAPVIDCGFCDYTANVDENLLKRLNIEIPYSDYDDTAIVGITLKLDNDQIDKFIDKKLDQSILQRMAREHFDECTYCCCESSVDIVQTVLDKEDKALYIVLPYEYMAIEEFIEQMVQFLNDLQIELLLHKESKEAA